MGAGCFREAGSQEWHGGQFALVGDWIFNQTDGLIDLYTLDGPQWPIGVVC